MVKRVPCRKCGNVVAETSKKCPYCGADPTKWLRKFQLLGIFLILAFAADLYLNDASITIFLVGIIQRLAGK